MSKNKHLHTQFIRFLIEKHQQDNPDGGIDIPEPDEREIKKRKPPVIDVEEEDEDEEPIDDEIADDEVIIEKLLNEYKKVKKEYEKRKLFNRR